MINQYFEVKPFFESQILICKDGTLTMKMANIRFYVKLNMLKIC